MIKKLILIWSFPLPHRFIFKNNSHVSKSAMHYYTQKKTLKKRTITINEWMKKIIKQEDTASDMVKSWVEMIMLMLNFCGSHIMQIKNVCINVYISEKELEKNKTITVE